MVNEELVSIQANSALYTSQSLYTLKLSHHFTLYGMLCLLIGH